jgi:peptidoglycan/xylan/chitin deacetylase (PgdA/CDA1 family)
MSLIQLADMKAHLNITFDTDDVLIQGKINAAEDWIASFTGGPWPPTTYPYPWGGALLEAIRQLAAHLYENREASLVGVTSQELPFGLLDLLTPYREWAF